LGMKTEAYSNDGEVLIMGAHDPMATLPTVAELDQLLAMGDTSYATSVEFHGVRPQVYRVDHDPHFVPITDQKPFLAGNVRYILSMTQVVQLFALAGGVLGLAGAAVWWGLRRQGDPRIDGRPFPAVAGLALLIGANFLIMEHTLVLMLFRRLYVYDDALGMGRSAFWRSRAWEACSWRLGFVPRWRSWQSSPCWFSSSMRSSSPSGESSSP
jgi:hypothetical protein